jgi:hypothetical protein
MSTTETLDSRIRSLVAELVTAAPSPPVLTQLEWTEDGGTPPPSRRHPPRRSRKALLAGVITVVVGAVLLLTVLLPGVERHSPPAAAAELRQIAANAVHQPPLQLARNQWLQTGQQVSFSAEVSRVGSTPTPGAQATVRASIKEWSNSVGESCLSATPSSAQFASPANARAWHAAGLLDLPKTQPVISCASVDGATAANGLGRGNGVISVSGLPTDPSILARELETGTTGLAGIDEVSSFAPDAGFERAAILLMGPTTGASPAFESALYNALAMLPGVESLGAMTTHSGTSGLGFAAESELGQSVIVVKPSTGALLEARNIEDPIAFTGLESAYVAPPPSPVFGAEGGFAVRVIIQWLDPIGSPSVVGTGALPSDLSLLPPVNDTGTITAIENPGVTAGQLAALEAKLRVHDGEPASESYVSSALQAASGADNGGSLTMSFTGPTSQVEAYASALKASGLFSSVVVQNVGASS